VVELYCLFNLALDGVGGKRHAPAALPPVRTRYPLYRALSKIGFEIQIFNFGCISSAHSELTPKRM